MIECLLSFHHAANNLFKICLYRKQHVATKTVQRGFVKDYSLINDGYAVNIVNNENDSAIEFHFHDCSNLQIT